MHQRYLTLYRAYSISFNSSNVGKLFWSWILTDCIKVQEKKRKESCCLVFPSSTRREIRHFHVVVVQRRQRNVQKSVMHVSSCCFANLNLLLFRRSRSRHRRRCLSSLLRSSKYCTWATSLNASLEVTWDTVIMLLAFGVPPSYTKEYILCKKFLLFQVT